MIKTGIVGAGGKMGRTLISLLETSEQLKLVAAIEQPGASVIGIDAGLNAGSEESGILISDDLAQVSGEIDVLIDFTISQATVKNLEICSASGTPMVIATTGLSAGEQKRLHEIGEAQPIVFSSNYSVGVNAMFRLVAEAARIFGDGVDIEIVESHHRHKVDAPSGTAISLGQFAANALGRELSEISVHGRYGQTGARDQTAIGFHAVRGGEIVGEHTVMFISGGERLEITHRAQSRANFAEGALRAAAWVVAQQPGVYDMLDVLGITKN